MHAINNIPINKNFESITPLSSMLSLEDRFLPEFDSQKLQTYELKEDYLMHIEDSSIDFTQCSKVSQNLQHTDIDIKILVSDSSSSFVMKIDQPFFFKEIGAGSSHVLVNVGLELSEWEEALVIYHHCGTGEHRLGLVSPNSHQFPTERFKHLFAYRPFDLEETCAIKAIYPIVARKFVPAS